MSTVLAALLLYRLLRSIFASGLIAIIQSSNIVNISESPLGGVLVWAQMRQPTQPHIYFDDYHNLFAHIVKRFLSRSGEKSGTILWYVALVLCEVLRVHSLLCRFCQAARLQDVFYRVWSYFSIQSYSREIMQAAHTSTLTSSAQLFSAHPTIVTSVCASEWSAYFVLRTLRVVLHNKNALYERDLYT